MSIIKPALRPKNPRFSSGPCTKNSFFDLMHLKDALLGRSHRSEIGQAKLKGAIQGTREILQIPHNYKIAIVPASDTGAIEMAMWSLLGARKVTMVAWESFGASWITDVVKQLKIDADLRIAEYGEIVDMFDINYENDVVFTWNGTTSGVRMPNGKAIPKNRSGLTICDATSAAFAMDLPWSKLDATTFSWQKVLGGEAAHGMLILSPRAVKRLESYTPDWPLPKIFRLTKGGKLIKEIFEGTTINTPSMLAVEDYLNAIDWARSIGGLDGLIKRAQANTAEINNFVSKREWIDFLANDPEIRSNTSICLKFTDARICNGAGFAKAIVKRLESENVALDIGAHRDAPAGLRIWCGATVDTSDIKAMLPWLEWAFKTELVLQNQSAQF